jgi:hypothetical protein
MIWPNPISENGWIRFQLEEGGNISLEMYDSQGRKVSTLVNGYKQPGNYTIPISKGFLPSGIYMIRLTTPAESTTRKLVLLK